MNYLLILVAFAVGAIAGDAITRKDPVSALLSSIRKLGIVSIIGSLSIGFAAAAVWEIIFGHGGL